MQHTVHAYITYRHEHTQAHIPTLMNLSDVLFLGPLFSFLVFFPIVNYSNSFFSCCENYCKKKKAKQNLFYTILKILSNYRQ